MGADDEDERFLGTKEEENCAANEELDENQRPDKDPARHRAFINGWLDEFPRTFREKSPHVLACTTLSSQLPFHSV